LNFSKLEIGFVMSCHGLGSVGGAYIGGWLTDRIGYYRVMFWSLILVGFLYFALILVKTFPLFCVMGFLTSLVGDAFRPAGMASITAYGGEELQTRSMSLYRLAINLGFGLGMAIAGFLAGIFGYQVLFIMDGSTCFAAAILFVLLLKEKKEIPKKQKEDAPQLVVYSAYNDNWYMMFIGFLLLNSIVFMQLLYTFPLFCKEALMMSEESLGGLMSYNGILIFVLEMPLIYILAKKRDQMGYIILGVVLIGLSFVVFNIFGSSFYVVVFSMTLVSIGEIVNFPLASSLALGRSNALNRGQYMGLYSMLFSVASIIGPPLGLQIVEHYGWGTLWSFLGILATISTIGLLYLRKNPQVSVQYQ